MTDQDATGKRRAIENKGALADRLNGEHSPSGGITPEEKAKRTAIRWNKKIYVCSPYRPQSKDPEIAKWQLQENITRAKLACRYVTSIGYMPLCPHLYFTSYLNDNNEPERITGLGFAMEWLLEADEMWVFGDEISEGMQEELDTAENWGIPVQFHSEPAITVFGLADSIKGTEYEKHWRHEIEEFERRRKERASHGVIPMGTQGNEKYKEDE